MASEDVIELDSSEDDAEPSPKRLKPRPNVMVHIPKLQGVTIKPAKKTINDSQVFGKVVANKLSNPFALRPPKIFPKSVLLKQKKELKKCIPVNSSSVINTHNLVKRFKNSGLTINKVSATKKNVQIPISMPSQVVRQNMTKITNNLHKPSIQITHIISQSKLKQNVNPYNKSLSTPKKQKIIDEVLTVEDDDDKINGKTAWYMKPEEVNNVEKQNNKEPKNKKYIEITIEDSPVKTSASKMFEVGTELAITVDDSPIKVIHNENNTQKFESKTPQSKKQLIYPSEKQILEEKVIEIEIEPMDVSENLEKFKEPSIIINDDMENKIPNTDYTENQTENTSTDENFHPVYEKFISLCFKLENSDDMKKIVEKKIKSYYRQVPKEYTESEGFIEMVSSKISSMEAMPQNMYLYIKDVVDDLNLQRKTAKASASTQISEKEDSIIDKSCEYDAKKQRQIRKLEKTIKKMYRAIQKLEEQEVDFDDDEDSVYLLTERYKERVVKCHAKLCQLTNTKMPSEPYIHVESKPGRPSAPAKKLEKWINKKVPIGTPLPFPDFHDVLRFVREANSEEKLGWNDADIMEEARDLFTRVGKKLQRRRQENEWRLASSRIPSNIDPAEQSEDLKKKLLENKKLAAKKEAAVLNKYADKQNQLNLEPEEIGDKEAEESPVESDEEEMQESSSLQNKGKRKERLRRLLQEKARKNVSDEKENTPQANTGDTINEQEVSNDNGEGSLKNKDVNNKKDDVKQNVDSDDILTKIDNILEMKENTDDLDKVLSLSDDSNDIGSDVDELHLLQKLHSQNEANSTLESSSSDSDSPISISDTLESSDIENKECDVISIENSSYSESENNKTENNTEAASLFDNNFVTDPLMNNKKTADENYISSKESETEANTSSQSDKNIHKENKVNDNFIERNLSSSDIVFEKEHSGNNKDQSGSASGSRLSNENKLVDSKEVNPEKSLEITAKNTNGSYKTSPLSQTSLFEADCKTMSASCNVTLVEKNNSQNEITKTEQSLYNKSNAVGEISECENAKSSTNLCSPDTLSKFSLSKINGNAI